MNRKQKNISHGSPKVYLRPCAEYTFYIWISILFFVVVLGSRNKFFNASSKNVLKHWSIFLFINPCEHPFSSFWSFSTTHKQCCTVSHDFCAICCDAYVCIIVVLHARALFFKSYNFQSFLQVQRFFRASLSVSSNYPFLILQAIIDICENPLKHRQKFQWSIALLPLHFSQD